MGVANPNLDVVNYTVQGRSGLTKAKWYFAINCSKDKVSLQVCASLKKGETSTSIVL